MTPPKRWALVVIVESPSVETAMDYARTELVDGLGPVRADGTGVVYLGEPCRVSPADEYETVELRLEADGEWLTTAPEPEAGGMSDATAAMLAKADLIRRGIIQPGPEAADMRRTDGLGGDERPSS